MSATELQVRVQAAIDQRVAGGDEVGVQVAVVDHGRVVVDAVSGSADPDQGRAAAAGTLFWAASTAKGVASAVAHALAERDELEYDLRAAEVWPEFAARGKDRVTLRHVLLHTAGVPPRRTRPRSSSCATGSTCARPLPRPSRGGSRGPALATTPRPSASARGDRAPSHGPQPVVVAARGGHRPARGQRRGPVRGARGAAGPGGLPAAAGWAAAPAARAGIAVAVMRNRFDSDLATVREIDRLVAAAPPHLPP